MTGARLRGLGFVALVVVAVAVAGGYLAYAALRDDGAAAEAPRVLTLGAEAVPKLAARPHLLFRNVSLGDEYGKVALVPLGAAGGARAVTELRCDRVDFAGGHGICLRADRGVLTSYDAVLFGPDFRETARFSIAGAPSRARVSPDGRFAAYTVFVTGHSYSAGSFSTRTAIVSASTGEEMGELEQFTVLRDGEPFRRVDFNFWGITFAPEGDRFYATLGTKGVTYLVEGDLRTRRLRVLREGVECPSVSPDGTRIAYKVRMGGSGRVTWRIAVLALAGGEPVTLAETRSVDDQVEWLDRSTIVYGLPEDDSGSAPTHVWRVPADGTGRPQRLIVGAWSPSTVAS